MDGADKRAWHLYSEMVAQGMKGRLIARKAAVDDRKEPDSYPSSSSGSWRDSKRLAALAAAISGRDYWQLKLIRPGARRAAREAAREEFDAIILHFLYALPLLKAFAGRRARLAVETHNYDPSVFSGFRKAARNPLTRLLCGRAIETSRRALAALPPGTVMIHVSQRDSEMWRRDRPDLEHRVIENGCTVRPRRAGPDYAAPGKKRLLFVGSLSAQMNQDGLRHFGANYWPLLKDAVEFHVVGSKPSPWVESYCSANGWILRGNVSENELEASYEAAHFAVLPFAYGAGSKLKLMEACGRAVPVLTTRAGLTGIETPPLLVRASDDPAFWRDTVLQTSFMSDSAIDAVLVFARQFSWAVLAQKLRGILEQAPLASV
jgi:glycosyltransferase involved in cell wall biosynthesis